MDAYKYTGLIVVSDELLMDCGVIPDTRERKPLSRWYRLRWRMEDMRERVAEKSYKVISGREFPVSDY